MLIVEEEEIIEISKDPRNLRISKICGEKKSVEDILSCLSSISFFKPNDRRFCERRDSTETPRILDWKSFLSVNTSFQDEAPRRARVLSLILCAWKTDPASFFAQLPLDLVKVISRMAGLIPYVMSSSKVLLMLRNSNLEPKIVAPTHAAILTQSLLPGHRSYVKHLVRNRMENCHHHLFFFDHLDKLLLHSNQYSLSDVFDMCVSAVEQMMETEPIFGSSSISGAALDNVVFGSAQSEWGFTIAQFAQLYSKKMGRELAAPKLWRGYVYDPKLKRVVRANPDDPKHAKMEPTFSKYVLGPIKQILQLASDENNESHLKEMCLRVGVQFPGGEKMTPASRVSKVMQGWLPLSPTLAKYIHLNFPNPLECVDQTLSAYFKTVRNLSTISMQNQSYLPFDMKSFPEWQNPGQMASLSRSFERLDPKGPLVAVAVEACYHCNRQIVLCQVLSGTLKVGVKVRTSQDPSSPKAIQRVYFPAHDSIAIEAVAGNLVYVIGRFEVGDILFDATWEAFPFTNKLRNTLELPLKCTVNGQKFPRYQLRQYLANFRESFLNEQMFDFFFDSELSAEILLRKLDAGGTPLKACLFETIMSKSPICESTSSNRHNRLRAFAEPLDLTFPLHMTNDEIKEIIKDKKELKSIGDITLVRASDSELQIDPELSPCVIINRCPTLQFSEISLSLKSALTFLLPHGTFSQGPLTNILITITDGVLHADAIHRGGGQIIPTARRLFEALQMLASPRFKVPVFRSHVFAAPQCPRSFLAEVRKALPRVKAIAQEAWGFEFELWAEDSIGWYNLVKKLSHGNAVSKTKFFKWEIWDADPCDPKSPAYSTVAQHFSEKEMNRFTSPLTHFQVSLVNNNENLN